MCEVGNRVHFVSQQIEFLQEACSLLRQFGNNRIMQCFVSLPNSVVIEVDADLKESGQCCIDQVRKTVFCVLFVQFFSLAGRLSKFVFGLLKLETTQRNIQRA